MNASENYEQPELVIGLVGPLGVDMDAVQSALDRSLRQVQYQPYLIHLTNEVSRGLIDGKSTAVGSNTYRSKMTASNKLRGVTKREDILALFAVLKIVENRSKINQIKFSLQDEAAETTPVAGSAYIVRQLKRTEEIRTLSRIYGNRFLQVSISIGEREQEQAVRSIVAKESPNLSDIEVAAEVRRLILADQNEEGEAFGQRLSETFQAGDVFIDGSSSKTIIEDCQRFICALFGMNSLSPTKDEFGSYLAKTASLRSIDLSRQVGSAIMSSEGEVISIGCNEVPKAGGGNYWCSDVRPQRDMDRKVEANRLETSRIVHNFLEALKEHGSLSEKPENLMQNAEFQKILKKALISDITEFGRMTHAEMSALTDAARLGRSTNGATIYVTTYPCHNCAKHLIAAGIKRIVYIEPYPKSRAISLHDDALSHEVGDNSKVVVEHFHGISPKRFRDFFEKGKRKGARNEALEWYEGEPRPMIGERFSSHVLLEPHFLEILREKFEGA